MNAELLDRFLSELLASGRAASTVQLRRERLEPAIRWFRAHGILTPPALRPEDIDSFLIHLRDGKRARETIKSHRISLRIFCAWLWKNGMVLTDPGMDLEPTKMVDDEDLPPEAPSIAEMAQLLAAIPVDSAIGQRNRAHTYLLYGCGLRLGESIGLMLADLDLNHPSIRIDGKGSKERSVPIPPQAILAMRDYLARRRDLVRGPDQGFLFVGADGKRLLASAYRQWLIRLGNRVLGRHIHPHLLRHACAVHMLLGRADIRIVQEMLGHSDLDTTKVYLRLLPDQLRAEYEKAMPDLMAR